MIVQFISDNVSKNRCHISIFWYIKRIGSGINIVWSVKYNLNLARKRIISNFVANILQADDFVRLEYVLGNGLYGSDEDQVLHSFVITLLHVVPCLGTRECVQTTFWLTKQTVMTITGVTIFPYTRYGIH